MPYLYEKNRYRVMPDGSTGLVLYEMWIIRYWPKTKVLWMCLWGRNDRFQRWYINKFLETINYNAKLVTNGKYPILHFVNGPLFVLTEPIGELYANLSDYNPRLGWGTLN